MLEACGCLKLLSIYFVVCVDATGVVHHQLGLLGTELHAVSCGGFEKKQKDNSNNGQRRQTTVVTKIKMSEFRRRTEAG